MTKVNNHADAIMLAQSPRGQYILSQALTLGIQKLKEVEGVHREVSNIKDMEFIRDHLFPLYKEVHGE